METITINGKQYQLDIDKAKEQGLLKEKDSRVRNWEEFRKKYGRAYIVDEISAFPKEANVFCTASQLTLHEAKAIAAFSKLLKLRRDWIGEWKPDWSAYTTCKFIIGYVNDSIVVNTRNTTARSLSFPTEQMAEEFLETFRDLIEEAKILI